jgi:hypothetical protein
MKNRNNSDIQTTLLPLRTCCAGIANMPCRVSDKTIVLHLEDTALIFWNGGECQESVKVESFFRFYPHKGQVWIMNVRKAVLVNEI